MTGTGANVVELVWAQVRRDPSRTAVRWRGRSLTYGELWDQAGRVAAGLAELGVQPGDVVGICARRSADLVAGIVGILRAGCAYLPLDPAYPEDRLRYMLDQAGAEVLVGDGGTAAGLVGDRPLLSLGSVGELPPTADDVLRPAGDIAYVMFTSGSTGVPKGVEQTHRALVNLVRWQLADSAVGAGEVTVQFAPISFDVSFQEIFATLASGGILLCLDDERRDPILLWRLLVRERVARLYLPFVMLQTLALFVDEFGGDVPPLREVITAGEQLRCDSRIKRLFAGLPGCRLVNQYGPTETHVCTRYLLPEDPQSWPLLPPIGTAVDGVRLHVLDEHGVPVPDGRSGELHVAGVAVARGYVGQPELTRQRFRPEPGGPDPMYATGDVVEWRAGELHYLGRNDDQTKINGIRVEPAEIESVLLSFPGVREAAVVARKDGGVGVRLFGFVSGDPEAIQVDLIRQRMAETMPAHLVPYQVHAMPAMPTTPSGKLDRAALVDAAGPPPPSAGSEDAPGLAAIWWSELRPADRHVESLRDAGVDSLAAARVAARIAEQFGVHVAIDDVLGAKSLEHLAEIVAASPSAPRLAAARPTGPVPATAMQRQIFVGELLDDEGPSHWVLIELDVTGAFDKGRAELAFERLTRRHDALRTRFEFAGSRFSQEYVAEARAIVRHVDTADLGAVRAELCGERYEFGDVAVPVIAIVRTGADRHRVLIRVHHAICDGWSVPLLCEEFAALYGGAELPPAVQPWQLASADASADGDLEYWVDRLRPVADRPPVGWGDDGVRAASPALRRLPFSLGAAEIDAVRAGARGGQATPFAVMLAAWVSVVGDTDRETCVAVPVSTRRTALDARCVGLFLNTTILPLTSRSVTFAALIDHTQHEVSQALMHRTAMLSDVLERLDVDRKSMHHPIAQMMFTLQPPGPRAWELPHGARMELRLDVGIPEATRFDLWLNLDDRGDEIVGWIDYDSNIVGEGRVRGLVDRWRQRLSGEGRAQEFTPGPRIAR
ncbi:amino acid adenylation domain-containing protein [Micromonospora haikouensis]|uniref:amino acid adenylation domain-containing protein n=1 Tax=Micromonospora haikouensis TaxID=686309 RepID=UPI003D70484D